MNIISRSDIYHNLYPLRNNFTFNKHHSCFTFDGGSINVVWFSQSDAHTVYMWIELTETSFRISSRTSTGALRYNTAFHSVQFKGVIAKSDCEAKSARNYYNRSRYHPQWRTGHIESWSEEPCLTRWLQQGTGSSTQEGWASSHSPKVSSSRWTSPQSLGSKGS